MVYGHLSGISSGRARLSEAGLAYCAMPPFVPAGYDLPSLVVKPELTLIDAKEIGERLFARAGFSMQVSNKGKHFRQAVEKFGSLGDLRDFLFKDEAQKILARYRDRESRPGDGVTDEGIILDRCRYLDLEAITTALEIEPAERRSEETYSLLSAILADWVGRRLLRRGLAMKCRHCDYMGWYPVETVSEAFTCRRCGISERWNVEHLHRVERRPPEPAWYYQLDEAFYQFVHANGFVTAATLASLEDASSLGFMYLPEVEYWPQGGSRSEECHEIDFVAVANGKLLLGECKTAVGKISKETRVQFSRHAELARALLADGFVLGTVCPVSQGRLSTLERMFSGGSLGSQFEFRAVSFEPLAGLL